MMWLHKLFLVIKYRPFFRCPMCRGTGWSYISAYAEPFECSTCWDHWKELTDVHLDCFEGRIPLLSWIRCRISIRCGLWYEAKLINLLRCKLGLHRWVACEDDTFCATCYLPK